MNRVSLVVSFLVTCASVLDAAVALAETPPFEVGETASALPGIVRISVPGRFARLGPGLAATAGYGFTESVVADSDKSHRVFGSVAASYRATEWFALGVRFDGRYDWHTGVPGGNGGGAVGDPGLLFQAGTTTKDLALGAEARVGFPGGKAPSLKFSAVSPELSALVAYAPKSVPLVLASRVGFRIDRSAETVPDPDRQMLADRISLGVSDTNALLLGAGISTPVTQEVEALAEWTWDVRVPAKGVGAAQSPMRLDFGGRFRASDSVSLELVAEFALSARPPIGIGTPLAVTEPRFGVFAGFAVRPPVPRTEETPTTPPVGSEPPTVTSKGRVAGRVTDGGGRPIAGAKVHVGTPGATDQMTNDRGEFELGGVLVGKTDLTVTAEGYKELVHPIAVTSAESAPIEVQLERALPVGQIRGLARSFNGEPIKAATVRVEPIGKEAVVGASGRFEVDVPPGEYDVIVKAPGYADQLRHVRVEANGVVVLDLDMRTRR
jgi:hypothetical protein